MLIYKQVLSPRISLQFADGVYLVLLMGLLEDYFLPLHNFYLTPESFDQKVGRNSRLCSFCIINTFFSPIVASFLLVPGKTEPGIFSSGALAKRLWYLMVKTTKSCLWNEWVNSP